MHPLLVSYFKFVKRFLPVSSETTSIGLDIGAGECKLVELRSVDGNFELVNWAIEPVLNADVNGTIQKMLQKLGSSTSSIYTAVFGKGTLIRYLDLPKMTSGDLKKSFSIEADKYFPFAQDQIYTDCYVLNPKSSDKKISVIAAAAKKEIIEQRVKLLTELNVTFSFIGINPVALANAFTVLGFEQPEKADAAVALLDMGDSVSSLIIFMNKSPLFTRDIYLGGRDFTKRISNTLGVSIEEAERLKKDPGDKKEEILKAGEAAVMNIIQELRLSFDYFATEKNCEIGTLFLTGGASSLDGLTESFERNLEIKVKRWNPVTSLKLAKNSSVEEDMKKKFLKLGVAIGLALYEYD